MGTSSSTAKVTCALCSKRKPGIVRPFLCNDSFCNLCWDSMLKRGNPRRCVMCSSGKRNRIVSAGFCNVCERPDETHFQECCKRYACYHCRRSAPWGKCACCNAVDESRLSPLIPQFRGAARPPAREAQRSRTATGRGTRTRCRTLWRNASQRGNARKNS